MDDRQILDDEQRRLAEEAKKEAPCYGDTILEHHEFANGECIYCGLTQPGGYKPRELKSVFHDDDE